MRPQNCGRSLNSMGVIKIYKNSDYLLVIPLEREYIIASTITKAVVKVDLGFYERFTKIQDLSNSEMNNCLELGLIRPNEFDETKYLRYLINKDRLNPENLIVYTTITTNCNFACPYCYQNGQTEEETLNNNTIQTIVDWSIKKAVRNNNQKCIFELYGGEPLLEYETLIAFLRCLKQKFSASDLKYETKLITNGYLLNKERIEELMKYNLSEVHITLDGDSTIHNSRRSLINGQGSYHKIIENLRILSDYPLNVVIRISIDKENSQSVINSISVLSFLNKEKSMIYPGKITNTASQINNKGSYCNKAIVNDSDHIALFIDFYRKLKELNFNYPNFYELGPCMTVSDNDCLISPNGSIYKCVDMIGQNKLSIGHVARDNYEPIYFGFMEAKQLNECVDSKCIFAALCSGGCIYESYLETKSIYTKKCGYSFLKAINTELIKLRYC